MPEEDNIQTRKNLKVPAEILNYIPEESARHYSIIPLGFEGSDLIVGAIKPNDLDVIDALNFLSSREGINYKIKKIDKEEFEKALEQYGKAGVAIGEAISKLEVDSTIIDEKALDIEGGEQDLIKEEAPVVKLLDNILLQAVQQQSSDVHIEPREGKTIVRYRVDGILREAFDLPKKIHNPVIARVKILSSLRLDEKRRPQDGRFSKIIKGRQVDFRVSSFPTSEGEKATLRVLDRGMGVKSLEEIGLGAEDKSLILDIIQKPYGLVLATGPTGSGKSTTLYSIISMLDSDGKNIVSLEDPVEYSIDGVNQSEVRSEIGYSFATGLRSILRGDPDIIFVGEIRDSETAKLAVQAALTGHLVFSTIHTNNAAGAIPRLIDFGVDPFFIAPTLNLVIAQRLLRKICPGHAKAVPVSKSSKEILAKELSSLPEKFRKKLPAVSKFHEPKPSKDCLDGMRGRTGVFELLKVTKNVEQVILDNPSEQAVFEIARNEGMLTMYENAVNKCANGEVPLREINKVSDTVLKNEEVAVAPEDAESNLGNDTDTYKEVKAEDKNGI